MPENESRIVKFIPDGVCTITNRDQEKTVLFFLEVDMGTESATSPKGDPTAIEQKILNYSTAAGTLSRFDRSAAGRSRRQYDGPELSVDLCCL